jgi:hypothetical protein
VRMAFGKMGWSWEVECVYHTISYRIILCSWLSRDLASTINALYLQCRPSLFECCEVIDK